MDDFELLTVIGEGIRGGSLILEYYCRSGSLDWRKDEDPMGDNTPLNESTTKNSPVGVVVGSSQTSIVDISNPFFLHASDSSGMVLVNTIFDGKGYGGWRRGILVALSAKNKVGFIDGTITIPIITSDSYKSWSRCNNMVISWLLNSLSKEIAESVLYSKTAKTIWEELEERFGQSNGPLLYQLQKEINESVQGNLDITSYYTKLKRLWDELDSLDICQPCTCDCSCGGKVRSHKSDQDARFIQFLMGLNEAYAGPRSNLLLLSPLPSVNYAYSLFIRDEKQREVHVSQHAAPTTFYASKQGTNTYSGSSTSTARISRQPYSSQKSVERKLVTEGKKIANGLFCSYCKKTNHTIENCYRLIGFPSDFKFTKSKKMGPPVKSNSAYSIDESGSNSGDKPMTQYQYHHLYQLLQHVRLGAEPQTNTEESATVNCAGPFNEEATGSW